MGSPAAAPLSREPSTGLGWAGVGIGWAVLAVAAGMALTHQVTALLPGALGVVGMASVVLGCHFLAAGKALWVYVAGLFATFLAAAGMAIVSHELSFAAGAEQVTCQVVKVQQETRTRTRTDSHGYRRTELVTTYWHTVRCPAEGPFTISSGTPRPEGATVQVLYNPSGNGSVRFAGGRSGSRNFGLALAGVAVLASLVLPFTAWRRGRRWAAGAVQPRYPAAGPAGAGWGGPVPGPYPAGPYQGAQPPPDSPEAAAAAVQAFQAQQAAREGRPVTAMDQAAAGFATRMVFRRMQRRQAETPPPQTSPYPPGPPPGDGRFGPGHPGPGPQDPGRSGPGQSGPASEPPPPPYEQW